MRGACLVACVLLLAVVTVNGEGDFPPPKLPKAPDGFNIHCDVCKTMMTRVQPYCERQEENLDYLPDFCTFNYNMVLRTECNYITSVMDYVWCPSACTQVRKLKSFTQDKICHHPLVNCTDRGLPLPSPSPSPLPSPTHPTNSDCVLCEYVLTRAAEMCMNTELADKVNIYHSCMEGTTSKHEFNLCTQFLDDIVEIADTRDPCTMISCDDPQVICHMVGDTCSIIPADGQSPEFWTRLAESRPSPSSLTNMTGLGPSDFRPGPSPYHSLAPRGYHAPNNVRSPGHLRTPSFDLQAEQKGVEADNAKTASKPVPVPSPLPLREVKIQ